MWINKSSSKDEVNSSENPLKSPLTERRGLSKVKLFITPLSSEAFFLAAYLNQETVWAQNKLENYFISSGLDRTKKRQ